MLVKLIDKYEVCMAEAVTVSGNDVVPLSSLIHCMRLCVAIRSDDSVYHHDVECLYGCHLFSQFDSVSTTTAVVDVAVHRVLPHEPGLHLSGGVPVHGQRHGRAEVQGKEGIRQGGPLLLLCHGWYVFFSFLCMYVVSLLYISGVLLSVFLLYGLRSNQ